LCIYLIHELDILIVILNLIFLRKKSTSLGIQVTRNNRYTL